MSRGVSPGPPVVASPPPPTQNPPCPPQPPPPPNTADTSDDRSGRPMFRSLGAPREAKLKPEAGADEPGRVVQGSGSPSGPDSARQAASTSSARSSDSPIRTA